MKLELIHLFVIVFGVSGCAAANVVAPTPVTRVSQAKAIALGLQFAQQGGIEIEA